MFVLTAALSTVMAFGQFRPMDNTGAGTAPDPATMVANKVAFLKALLTLTDAQVTQTTTIFTNEITQETTLRASIDTARTSLNTAIKSNATSSIDQYAAQIGTLTGQMTAVDAKAEAAFYALLTTDQKTKYDALATAGPGGPGHGRP